MDRSSLLVRSAAFGAAACLFSACAPAAPSPPSAPVAPATSAEPADRIDGRALFAELVAWTRAYHVFSDAAAENLGRRWEEDRPVLEAEFAAATTREQLEVALSHFGNSLHDEHCRYRPAARGPRLRQPLQLDVEWTSGAPVFYVAAAREEAAKAGVVAGDVVESVDGIAAAEILDRLRLTSNANHPRALAEDVARYLTSRRPHESTARAGDASRWVFVERGTRRRKVFSGAWRSPPEPEETDFAVDYGAKECGGGDARDYGPYRLVARGARHCVYASEDPAFEPYPVVRVVSFRYHNDHQMIRADQANLKHTLDHLARTRGVILDLQDNGGGNNPNLFLDWWAPGPYADSWTVTRLVPELSTARALDDAGLNMSPPQVDFQLRALAASPGGFAPRRPFMCRPDTCAWDNRYAPSHQVTHAPVALLLGPGCVSSCDAFALVFEENGFGPLVGRPPRSGFTTHRARKQLSHGLGTIDFAVSYDVSARTGEPIEARPRRLTDPVERTFENRSVYDRLLVEAAIRALSRRAGDARPEAVRRASSRPRPDPG